MKPNGNVWLLTLLSGATVGQLLAGALRPPEWDRPHGDQAVGDADQGPGLD